MANEKEVVAGDNGLDLIELLQIIWKSKWIILAMMVLGVLVTFIKVNYFTQDRYTANGILYVSNKSADGDTEVTKITQSDINSSRTLGTTYMEVLKTRSFLTDVGRAAYENHTTKLYKYGEIRQMMSVAAINETELLNISVTAESPHDAYLIAEQILTLAPQKLNSVFKSGEVEIVDEVVEPTSPVSKGGTRKMMLGAFVGVALGAVLVFILNFFDTKVRKSDDVAKRYNVSILGEIAK